MSMENCSRPQDWTPVPTACQRWVGKEVWVHLDGNHPERPWPLLGIDAAGIIIRRLDINRLELIPWSKIKHLFLSGAWNDTP